MPIPTGGALSFALHLRSTSVKARASSRLSASCLSIVKNTPTIVLPTHHHHHPPPDCPSACLPAAPLLSPRDFLPFACRLGGAFHGATEPFQRHLSCPYYALCFNTSRGSWPSSTRACSSSPSPATPRPAPLLLDTRPRVRRRPQNPRSLPTQPAQPRNREPPRALLGLLTTPSTASSTPTPQPTPGLTNPPPRPWMCTRLCPIP